MKQIKFLGAAGMVTGSSYKLTSDTGQEILIDMGMFQGLKEETAWNFQPLQFDPRNLTDVILTHAHLDHCGRLPLLWKHGFRGRIHMTPPTLDLATLVLNDTAKIASENPQTALFTDRDVRECLNQTHLVNYHQDFKLGDFNIKFIDAGHLLGSASLEITDSKKFIFSGDLGNSPQLIIKPTEFFDSADYVVMESTYGNKTHPNDHPMDIIGNEINSVEKTGGTLLIPAFALERTQDILVLIKQLKTSGRINPRTPIFLDSPMGIKATQIYLDYADFWNPTAKEDFNHSVPFDFDGLEVVEEHRFSAKIKKIKGPKVIIAGSGMMTGGRILSHAKEFLSQKNTRVLMVGYQGEETLGREILEGADSVQIDKRSVPVRAAINQTESLSSHADQPRLFNWLQKIKGVQKLFLTHGDEEPRQVFSEKVKAELQIPETHLPKMNEEFEL